MGSLIDNLALGFSVALSWQGLFFVVIGVALGTLVGVLPGIGTTATISLLLPLTFYVEPTMAIIMLAGIYYGGAYGGSTTSILLNVPGSASAAVTCLDGHPMARQGRAGVALFISCVVSLFGGLVGLGLLIAFAPSLARLALTFGPYEYFALMLLGLVGAVIMSSAGFLRATAAVLIGFLLGLIGNDVQTTLPRFTFGQLDLVDGISIVALALGLFGVSEVIRSARTADDQQLITRKVSFRSMIPTREDVRRSTPAAIRGTAIGSVLGILPGTGSLIASFMSYAVEKRVSKHPEEFGKGAVEGVASPEAANNAAVQTAFIPTLALGIPGDAVMALMLAALIIHGVIPGPGMLTNHPEVFWGVTASFLVGNIALVILSLPMIGVWIRLLSIPYRHLFPAIMVFLCIGVYSVNQSVFDVLMTAVIGGVGYFLAVMRIDIAALLLGFVLGPMMEEELRRAMLIARGNWAVFTQRPLTALILILVLAILAYAALPSLRKWWQRRTSSGHA
jgi:putative tricarboxylic transport membrane protein